MLLRRVVSYDEYWLNESAEDQISSDLVRDIFDKVVKTDQMIDKYEPIYYKDLDDPIPFEIKVRLKRVKSPDLENDSEFKNTPWEIHNLEKHGFVLKANTFIQGNAHDESLIEVIILIDPTAEPKCHKELYYKLHDFIAHEIHHVTQYDTEEEKHELNRNPDKTKKREAAEDDYRYFLLDDEIPAMIKGMNRRAVIENRPLDEIFIEYFEPFLKHGFMTQEQYEEVMKKYIEYAIRHKPNAKFSQKAKTFLGREV